MISDISYAQLTRLHPERERWQWKWPEYRLAYKGGHEFLMAAGELVRGRDGRSDATLASIVPVNQQTPRRRFLRQLEGEPNETYYAFWDRAYYLNYLGGILDYFRHYLFSQPPIIRPTEGRDVPDWWTAFYDDATGNGKGYVDFVKEAFLDVEIDRYAGWLFGTNLLVGAADPEDDQVVLTPYRAEEIYDWQRDQAGELEWIVLCKKESVRDFPDDRKQYQEITFINRDEWQTWQVTQNAKGEYSIESLGGAVHGLGCVPFEMLEIPHGLWVTDKLYSWQIDLFNKMCRLGNAQLMGCIVQPFIQSSDPGAQNRIFGEGVLLTLKSADAVGGGAEDMGWKSPDVGPLEFIAAQIEKERDEGYRIAYSMSTAVDATASRLAQSGISKQEDRKQAEVILIGLGSYIKPSMVRTANMLSRIYGDDITWMVDGYDNFQVSSLEEELQTASLVSAFGFWSKTAEAELHKTIETGRILGHVDEEVKETIRKEIDERMEQEQEAASAPQMVGDVVVDPNAPVDANGDPAQPDTTGSPMK